MVRPSAVSLSAFYVLCLNCVAVLLLPTGQFLRMSSLSSVAPWRTQAPLSLEKGPGALISVLNKFDWSVFEQQGVYLDVDRY